MAQQKMHCAFQRTSLDIQKDANGHKLSSIESVGDDYFSGDTKDSEVSSILWRKYNHRCTGLAFLTHEPNGYRLIIMPLLCHKSQISKRPPQTNVDNLNMITLSPFDSLKGGAQEIYIRPITDKDWYIESSIARSILRRHFFHHSYIKGFVNDENNWQLFVISSFCQNPYISVEYPLVISSGSDSANSAHKYVDGHNGNKCTERKSRRKSINRRQENNQHSITSGLTQLNGEKGSSKSQGDCCGNIDLCVDLPRDAARVAISLPDHLGKTTQNVITDDSLMLKTITSCSIIIDTSEAGLPYIGQCFNSDNHISDSENGCQIFSSTKSLLNQETHNVVPKLSRYSDPYYTKVNDSLMLDSDSLRTTDGESCTAEPNLKLSDKANAGMQILMSSFDSVRKEVSCSEDLLGSVVEPCNRARKKNRTRQDTDRAGKSHALGKREKHFRKVPQESRVHKISSLGNLNGHSGKENTHSIWQKVRKNDVDRCNYKDNTDNSQVNNVYKQAPVHCKHHSISNSCMLSKPEDSNLTKLKVSRKVKRKKKTGSKQEFHCYCSKESHAIKVCSCACPKINTQQNGISSANAGRQKALGIDSGSVSRMSSRIQFQTKKLESVSYKRVQKSEASSGDLDAYESTPAAGPTLSVQKNHSTLSSPPCCIADLSEVHKDLAFFNNDEAKREKEMPPADHSEQKAGFEAVSGKCILVGENNSGTPDLGQSTLSAEELKFAEECFSLGDIERLQSSSDPCFLAHSTEVDHSSLVSEYGNTILSEDERQVERFAGNGTFTPIDWCSLVAKSCIICEVKEQSVSGSESDLRSIFAAVNNAYKAQLASEAFEKVSGCVIAEFEKFIYSSSPVICKSLDVNSCQACSTAQTVGASSCEHETPNLPLGSLWQWYEKHGACGLEVRPEDYENSKRLGIDRFAFRAYFVPYLSAVQLFKQCRSPSTVNRATGAHEKKSSESSSSVGLHSAFPMLVPQPCKENTSILSQLNHASNGESSLSCMNEKVHNQSLSNDGMELLFEYFESEQPQRRRPLFEMIKDLASGETPLKCRLSGDPTILETVGLHDLHPGSWFSVAWYPIYRIPDGKLRASFLTYHSLGHLVRRGPTLCSHCADASIVSPVVGLQCYNAQGECWFRPRYLRMCKEDWLLDTDPSQILKERIRTLEKTASLMARAVVRIGNQTYANRQPDYEFFLSRQC